MSFIPLDIPPGFARKGTDYSQQGRWRDGNLVRFQDKSVRPIGGWALVTEIDTDGELVEMAGTCRSAWSWRDNLGREWTVFGTTQGLYAYDGTHFYDITPIDLASATEDVGAVYGYNTGFYNTENYNEPVGDGDPEAPPEPTTARQYGYWHLDNQGENLVASIDSDGRVFTWDPNTPSTVAEPITGTDVPDTARGVAMTDERHIVVIGGDDGGAFTPRRVRWSDVESADFTPSATSLAGDLDLQTEGIAIRVLRFRKETLVLTDTDIHRMVYQGYPLVYSLEKIGSGCGIANPGAVAASANLLFWVGPRGFFVYDGNQVQPLDCELFNTPGDGAALISQSGKLAVGHNELHNEFWVFYPSNPTSNPDRYILWNYLKGWWADGEMSRSMWFDSYLTDYPFATEPFINGSNDPASRLYVHEIGYQRPGYSGSQERIESAPIELGKGDTFLSVNSVMQDADINEGARLNVGFSFYRSPNTAAIKVIGPTTLDAVRGYTDARGCGRMMSIEISAAEGSSGDWRVGRWRVDVSEDGAMR